MLNRLRDIFRAHSPSRAYIEALRECGNKFAEGFAEGMKTVKDDPAFIEWQKALKEYAEKQSPPPFRE